AEHLGITTTTVKVRLHRARKALRELLEETPWDR
ncbi:MAG: RNA polymerase sigma factor, partial [Actinobacteria bacterium]|nr:RNA polymerase sigma factor [Actinomycetota bacterium]NIS36103.1 RNA polymerase sigma factor [Actinomycetota bacterium]NIU22159.1 RNA polymerase sigma factor [Actinomycetota bacterium]NIU70677.1 RNA polymerase sigma factor [Actinomycetota bacterium]NIV90276.1 RNA polymerase sigma factor [Actinomycetota bacterium]